MQEEQEEVGKGQELVYSLNDRPPWYLCILLGFQVSPAPSVAPLLSPLLPLSFCNPALGTLKEKQNGHVTLTISTLAAPLEPAKAAYNERPVGFGIRRGNCIDGFPHRDS